MEDSDETPVRMGIDGNISGKFVRGRGGLFALA
jgi:hypothetical protein